MIIRACIYRWACDVRRAPFLTIISWLRANPGTGPGSDWSDPDFNGDCNQILEICTLYYVILLIYLKKMYLIMA
jgi:hypothetical protein